MKKYLILFLASLLLFCGISCNLDGEEGLIQAAGNSVRKESYIVYSIVGKNASGYILATDSGIVFPDGSKKGNGMLAKHVLFADDTGVVYSNEETGKLAFLSFGADDFSYGSVTTPLMDNIALIGNPYSTDGVNFSYIFKTRADALSDYSKYKVAYLASPTVGGSFNPIALSANEVELKTENSVAIIGKNLFRSSLAPAVKKDPTESYWFTASGSPQTITPATRIYRGMCEAGSNYVTIDYKGVIRIDDNDVRNTDTNLYHRPAMFYDGTYVAIVTPSSNYIYLVNVAGSSAERITIAGLTSTQVIAILGGDRSSGYTILTAESGIKTIDISSQRVV